MKGESKAMTSEDYKATLAEVFSTLKLESTMLRIAKIPDHVKDSLQRILFALLRMNLEPIPDKDVRECIVNLKSDLVLLEMGDILRKDYLSKLEEALKVLDKHVK